MRRSLVLMSLVLLCAGCTNSSGNVGDMQSYPLPLAEADWIRNGEPIKFEEEFWYPMDDTENFIDAEVHLSGEYRGVQFFVDKKDVRPYNRLYTKFGKNKYRYFEKRSVP